HHQRVYFTSAPMRRWLEQLGLDYIRAEQKSTPDTVFRAEASVRAAYLRGLFDTDGSVGKINIRFTTSSPQLARDVHALLLSLGIVSSLSSQNARHHKVIISGPSIPPFQRHVGFSVARKAALVPRLALRAQRGKTNRDVIPFGKELMREYKRG